MIENWCEILMDQIEWLKEPYTMREQIFLKWKPVIESLSNGNEKKWFDEYKGFPLNNQQIEHFNNLPIADNFTLPVARRVYAQTVNIDIITPSNEK